MYALLDATKRQLSMQVRRGGNGYSIEALCEQLLDIAEARAANRAGHRAALRRVRIGYANETNSGKIGKDARMVAAHNADAGYADA
jgi:hypothetical protein